MGTQPAALELSPQGTISPITVLLLMSLLGTVSECVKKVVFGQEVTHPVFEVFW